MREKLYTDGAAVEIESFECNRITYNNEVNSCAQEAYSIAITVK